VTAQRLPRILCLVLAALAALALPGCGTNEPNEPFVDDSLVEAPAEPDAGADEDDADPPAVVASDTYAVDGMIGQINGRPIFADTVFHGDDPIHDQLAALGRRLARPVFRVRSRELIRSRLRQMLLDSLILAEAERDLTDPQRQGLRYTMQKRREELVRLYGQGSEAAARENILEQTGRSLDATLEDFRKAVVVREHIRAVIDPKINVTRRDVERYYRDQLDQFQPDATRDLRLIHVDTRDQAEEITRRLDAGETFAQVADSEVNLFTASGGLFEGAIGDQPLRYPELNRALAPLAEGGHAGPIAVEDDFWFVYIESIDAPQQKTLMDVQLDIERTLKVRQRQEQTDRYYKQLLSGTDPQAVARMTDALVEIAVNRYAAIDDAGTLAPDA
jgi:hypothetical protein